MMGTSLILVALSALTLVVAQTGTGTAGTNFTINVNNIPLTERGAVSTQLTRHPIC
jgi:hypothetical protein